MQISVIVPCYNSMPILRTMIEKTTEELNALGLTEHEFILVNDCSPKPETLPFLKSIADEFPSVKVVDLAKNAGQANAQVAALHYVSGDIILNMDDDMQTHPKNIPALYNKLMEGYDLVLGSYIKKRHAFHRRLMTAMDNRFEEVFLKKPKDLSFTSFWITRKYITDEIIKYRNPYAFMEGLFLRTAGKIANVRIEHFDRSEGKSGYTLKKLFGLWSNFTGFTVLPLRIAGIVGGITACGGFIFGIVTLIRRILNPAMAAGYASLLCIMLFFFGLNMLFVGLIGEYVGRTFMAVNSAPQFVIKDTYHFDEEKDKKEDTK